MALTGEPDGPPVKSGLSLVDFSGGYVSALALVAGVWRARRDGVGCDCDTSLFETALSLLTYVGTWAATRGARGRAARRVRAPVDRALPGVPDRGRVDHGRGGEAEVLARVVLGSGAVAGRRSAVRGVRGALRASRGAARPAASAVSGAVVGGGDRAAVGGGCAVRRGQRRARRARRPAGRGAGVGRRPTSTRGSARCGSSRRRCGWARRTRPRRRAARTRSRCCASCAATTTRALRRRERRGVRMTGRTSSRSASRFPGVDEGTSYGTPSLKVRGKFMCRLRTNPDALVVRMIDLADRDALLKGEPDVFFITPHYDELPGRARPAGGGRAGAARGADRGRVAPAGRQAGGRGVRRR